MTYTMTWNVRYARQTWVLSHVRHCDSTRKRDVWDVLFIHIVGFSRLLSVVNDLTTRNWKKKTCQSVTLSSLVIKSLQQIVLFCDAAHVTSSEVLDFDEFYELHEWSFHCHHDVLDEEDDECHFWYCQKGINKSRSSPDSWRRRCIFVNASLKSDRSFIVVFRPDVLREIGQVFLYLNFGRHAISENFMRPLVHLDAYFFSSINSELRVTKFQIFLEVILNFFKNFFDASLS